MQDTHNRCISCNEYYQYASVQVSSKKENSIQHIYQVSHKKIAQGVFVYRIHIGEEINLVTMVRELENI